MQGALYRVLRHIEVCRNLKRVVLALAEHLVGQFDLAGGEAFHAALFAPGIEAEWPRSRSDLGGEATRARSRREAPSRILIVISTLTTRALGRMPKSLRASID